MQLLSVDLNQQAPLPSVFNGFMTNSTPNLVAWMAEYQRYLDLVDAGAAEDAAALRLEIEEGLKWVELSWADLEFAVGQKS